MINSLYNSILSKYINIGSKVRQGGFTFLEIMIALSIVAGVVITVLTSLNYHLGLISENRDTVLATILAAEKMQEVKLFGIPHEMEGVFDEELSQFTWQLDVLDIKEITGIRKISVGVSWEDGRGVHLTSYDIPE